MTPFMWVVLILCVTGIVYVIWEFAKWVESEKERQDREWPR